MIQTSGLLEGTDLKPKDLADYMREYAISLGAQEMIRIRWKTEANQAAAAASINATAAELEALIKLFADDGYTSEGAARCNVLQTSLQQAAGEDRLQVDGGGALVLRKQQDYTGSQSLAQTAILTLEEAGLVVCTDSWWPAYKRPWRQCAGCGRYVVPGGPQPELKEWMDKMPNVAGRLR